MKNFVKKQVAMTLEVAKELPSPFTSRCYKCMSEDTCAITFSTLRKRGLVKVVKEEHYLYDEDDPKAIGTRYYYELDTERLNDYPKYANKRAIEARKDKIAEYTRRIAYLAKEIVDLS